MAASPIGVLVLQLGTPDAPTRPALRRYLSQFLSDRRVLALNRLAWYPILYGIILQTRPARSAKLYKKVWTPDGSPLLATSLAQANGMRARLAATAKADTPAVHVAVAMRYGNPSIEAAVDQ